MGDAERSPVAEPTILVESAGGVVTLTLNRPDKLNAISYEMLELLGATLDELAGRDDVACLVLAGAGRSFAAGFDLESLPDDAEQFQFMAAVIDSLEAFPHPTVARVHGHCLTGALELALACDVIVAAEDATFADGHSHWGLVPVCGMSVRLPERVGAGRAKLLSFSGLRIDGREALAWGLADAAVPAADLDAKVAEISGAIAANSIDANRILKELVATSTGDAMTRDQALAAERELRLGVPGDREERLARGR